jgi:hypothetical protein
MLLVAVVVLVFRGRRASWRALRAGGVLAVATVVVCVIAAAVTLVWQLAVQPASLESPAATLGKASPSMIGFILSRAVGTYGWGEAAPPAILVQFWALMVAALVVLGVASAVRRRARREITALVLNVVLSVAVIAAFLAFGSHAGQVQGRWFIAPLAGIPLLAGWMAATQPVAASFVRTTRIVSIALVIGVSACLAVFWWLNEYRYSVKGGSLFFLGRSVWQPPLGWAPWIACAVLGLIALVISALPERTIAGQPGETTATSSETIGMPA